MAFKLSCKLLTQLKWVSMFSTAGLNKKPPPGYEFLVVFVLHCEVMMLFISGFMNVLWLITYWVALSFVM